MTTLRTSLSFLLATTLGALSSAQNLTAHPQESVQNSGGIPDVLGSFLGSNAEARTQILVPRNELPAVPAQLVGIQVRGMMGSPMVYTSLRIDVGETTATQLQATFANNLPLPTTTVLPAGPLTLPLATATWSTLSFPVPHNFSGSAALVLDIRKVVNTALSFPLQGTAAAPSPVRSDRPTMRIAAGALGSGAAAATVATTVSTDTIQFRLLWANAPTLRNLSNPSPTTLNAYGLGGQVTLTVQHTPGALFALAIAPSFLPTPVTVAGFAGELRLNNATVIGSSLLDAQGLGLAVVPLPTTAVFVGLHYSYQAVVLDPASGLLTFTNGTDHFVNP